jgi:hypothetical protein
MVDYSMISTTILLGIYILSVLMLFGKALLKPINQYRLHPTILVGLYSFVPALSLGRQMLTTEFQAIITPVPVWFTGDLASLTLILIIPCRKWIRKNALERPTQSARQGLDQLPGRIMAIEAKASEGSMEHDEADRCKFGIQRQLDRSTAIDGPGRFLYLMIKIHLFRLGLQILRSVVIYFETVGALSWHTLSICSSMIIVDVALILGPYMLLMTSIALLDGQSHLIDLKA